MATPPSYKDLRMQAEDSQAKEGLMQQRESMAQQVQATADANTNPVLANYMSKQTQQGLTPQSGDRNAGIVQAVMQGQIDLRQVLADDTVPPEVKDYLINMINQTRQQNVGLGQLG